jgi:hypothetical protein
MIRHEDLLTSKADNNVVLQDLPTATGMLLATAPTVRASSPNNLKDDVPGMLAGCRCIFTNHSHNGRRRRCNSLALCAGSTAHDAVLAPLVEGGACTTFSVRIGGGRGHGVQLWCVIVFVPCRAKTQKQA